MADLPPFDPSLPPVPQSEELAAITGAIGRRPISGRFTLFQRPELPGLELHHGENVRDVLGSHTHDAYDLVLIHSGTRRVTHRGETQVLGPGSLFVNVSGEPHAGQSPEGWSFSSLYLPSSYFLEANREVGGGDRLPGFSSLVLAQPAVTERFRQACELLANGDEPLASESVLLATLVSTLLRMADGKPKLPKVGHERRAVRRVQEHLRENLSGNVRLEALSELAGLSRFHLIRVFRAATGVAPHAWQLQLRIHWAKVLLTQGRPLVEVALETGFADQSHFTRKFKQVVGMTPGAFLQLTPSRARGPAPAGTPR
jgi:AraC-like DNA-binding protein